MFRQVDKATVIEDQKYTENLYLDNQTIGETPVFISFTRPMLSMKHQPISPPKILPLPFNPNSADITPKALFGAFHQLGALQNANKLKSLIEKALNQGLDINIQNDDNYTLLHYTTEGFYDIAEFLLEKEANPNIQNNNKDTPLHIIAKRNLRDKKEEINLTKLLLEKGALTELKDSLEWTPLQSAASAGHVEVIKSLIAYRADLNPKPPSWGFYKGKSISELAPEKQLALKAFLKLAIACFNNDFGIVDDSVTTKDIQKFKEWKTSITPVNSKFFPQHLTELHHLKNFLETKAEFIADKTIEKIDDTLNFYVQEANNSRLELTGEAHEEAS